MLAIDRIHFIQTLGKLCDNKYHLSVEANVIVLDAKSSPTRKTFELLERIKEYLTVNIHCLQRDNLKALSSLKIKLFSYTNENEGKSSIEIFFNKIVNIITKKEEEIVVENKISPRILIRVAEAPRDIHELCNNLLLALEFFPRYVLNESFEVYDCNLCGMPPGWLQERVFASLKETLFMLDTKASLSIKDQELNALLVDLISRYKPIIPVEICWINETTKKVVLFKTAVDSIKKKIPLVANRKLLIANSLEFKNLFRTTPFDLYLQTTGGLCLILPKDGLPKEYGFDGDYLKKWQGFNYDFSEDDQLSCPKDIKLLLKNEDEEKRYARLILYDGHGWYAENEYDATSSHPGTIVGFPTPVFQQVLEALASSNLAFLAIDGCHIGGVNTLNIHLPQGGVPCPIVVLSSLETSRIHSDDESGIPLLKIAKKSLFPHHLGKITSLPQQLTEKDFVLLSNHFIGNTREQQIASILLPTNNPNIPRVPLGLSKQESYFLDVDQAMKKEKRRNPYITTIEDKNFNRKAYFFSHPLSLWKIESQIPFSIALLSRGSSNFHLIKELHLPKIQLEKLAKKTFNWIDKPTNIRHWVSLETIAPKAFFIGKLTCLLEGKPVILLNVIVRRLPECREILFKINEEEDFTRIHLTKHPGKTKYNDRWKQEPELTKVPHSEAIYILHQTIAAACPSEKQLLALTAGNLSIVDLIEAIQKLFWGDFLPLESRLYASIFHVSKTLQGPITQGTFKELLQEVVSKYNENSEPAKVMLQRAYEFSQILKNIPLSEVILASTHTPLMHATNSNHFENVKAILGETPELLDITQLNGSTAFLMACIKDYGEISEYLLHKGADPLLRNRFKNCPFLAACTNGNLKLVKLIIEKTQCDLSGILGCQALNQAILKGKKEVAEFLITKGAGLSVEPINISTLLRNSLWYQNELFPLLIDYPHWDVNFIDSNSGLSLLNFCALNGDYEFVKILINRGAALNLADNLGNHALHNAIIGPSEQKIDMIKLLLKGGAHVNQQTKEKLNTPLHLAIHAKNYAVIDVLLNAGASWMLEDIQDQTALELAAKNLEILIYILKHPSFKISQTGAVRSKDDKRTDVFRISYPDSFPLQRAVFSNNLELAKIFISYGANIHQKFQGGSLVYYPYSYSARYEMLEFLVDSNVDLIEISDSGSILHSICTDKNVPLPLLEKIIKKAPELLHIKNFHGQTPLFRCLDMPDSDENPALKVLVNLDNDLIMQDIAKLLALCGKKNAHYLAKEIVRKAIEIALVTEKKHPAQDLYRAILDNDEAKALDWIKFNGSQINSCHIIGFSPLIVALCLWPNDKGRVIIEEMIKSKIKIQICLPGSLQTALHLACRNNDLKLIELLIANGADPSAQDAQNQRPLHGLAGTLLLDFVQKLEKHVCHLQGSWKADLLETVIKEERNEKERELFTYLLKDYQDNADLNYQLLRVAILKNDHEAMEIFIKMPTLKVNKLNPKRKTLIDFAVKKQNPWILEKLLQKGANPNLIGRLYYQSPLYRVLFTGSNSFKFLMADLLIQYKAEINLKTPYKSLLHEAVERNDIEIVKYLLGKGVDKNLKKTGRTALEFAKKKNHGEIYQLLLG